VLDGLNRYAYCGNNPINYTDPTGNISQSDAMSITIAAQNAQGITPGGGGGGSGQLYDWYGSNYDPKHDAWYGSSGARRTFDQMMQDTAGYQRVRITEVGTGKSWVASSVGGDPASGGATNNDNGCGVWLSGSGRGGGDGGGGSRSSLNHLVQSAETIPSIGSNPDTLLLGPVAALFILFVKEVNDAKWANELKRRQAAMASEEEKPKTPPPVTKPQEQVKKATTLQPPSNFNDDNDNKKGKFREKTKGANKADRKRVDDVAKKYNIDRRKFGDFIEETKPGESRAPSDNYSYQDLCRLAEEFIELGY
jgi:hypothetical protein